MAKYRKSRIEARANSEEVKVQVELSMTEVLSIRSEMEQLCARIGLQVMTALMNKELEDKTGRWGQQTVYRHGTQKGYVIYDGRKLPINHGRLRDKQNREVPLESYEAFQSRGRMQEAVARKVIRQCSTRNYEGAVQELAQGYGIKKSSISRHFKACTARQLQQLLERPVPPDLVALVIDGQHFARNCVTVAMGIDKKGNKHVLGLWHGATENSTVATALLEDLQGRGLNPSHPILVVIDGSKALRKAIQTVLGERAVVQRCRVHKQRNVVEHLPKDKQGQAIRRLRTAWDKDDAKEAEKELRKVVQWLERLSPMAARSLQEGLEETLTLQRLKINHALARTFSSTNMIESCFSQVETMTARVKLWRDGMMVVRWAAAALLFAETRFRRINGVEQLTSLVESLEALQKENILKAA